MKPHIDRFNSLFTKCRSLPLYVMQGLKNTNYTLSQNGITLIFRGKCYHPLRYQNKNVTSRGMAGYWHCLSFYCLGKNLSMTLFLTLIPNQSKNPMDLCFISDTNKVSSKYLHSPSQPNLPEPLGVASAVLNSLSSFSVSTLTTL